MNPWYNKAITQNGNQGTQWRHEREERSFWRNAILCPWGVKHENLVLSNGLIKAKITTIRRMCDLAFQTLAPICSDQFERLTIDSGKRHPNLLLLSRLIKPNFRAYDTSFSAFCAICHWWLQSLCWSCGKVNRPFKQKYYLIRQQGLKLALHAKPLCTMTYTHNLALWSLSRVVLPGMPGG